MTAPNKQALREAADKAISEEGETWWSEGQLASDYGLALHKADATFIAAANPATVLALLDELESAEKRIAELEARQIALPQRLSPEGYHIDEAYMVDDAEGEYLDREAVIEAIRAAGIKIKGE